MLQKHYIDSHKVLTGPMVLGLMAAYGAWRNPTAWLYLAEHGVYGLLWVLKSRVFADKRFEQPATASYGALIWLALSLYWIAPWIIAARAVVAPPFVMGLSVTLYALGVFFHFVADMQKWMHLRHCPGALLSNGLWRTCRNPNYFGELLIYVGFSMLAMHPAPLCALGAMVLAEWIPSMRRKDRSLARYAEFAAWKARSGLLIPHL